MTKYRTGRLTVVVGARSRSKMNHDQAWRMVNDWFRNGWG